MELKTPVGAPLAQAYAPAAPSATVATVATVPVRSLELAAPADELTALVRRHRALVEAIEITPSANGYPPSGQGALVYVPQLNRVEDLTRFFRLVNGKLADGGLFVANMETLAQRRVRVRGRTAGVWGAIRSRLDFLVHRVGPRLWLTKGLYSAMSRPRNRAISLTEALGRLVHAGFEVVDLEVGPRRTAFVVRKIAAPSPNRPDNTGIVFRMARIGQSGETIRVFKLRTMHPYAQYLQDYIFQGHSVAPAGKFQNDFRVTRWGQLLRRYWIDEIPMLINWAMGDLKLVGVRPLSRHYLSLYPSEVRERRSRHKPGLIPPYYADLPTGLEEFVDSERRYLEAYEKRPVRTDLRYLGRALWNIVVRSARSS